MKFIKANRHVSQWWHVEDGPLMDTDPRRLSHGQFRVKRISVSWLDGEVQRVYVSGHNIKTDGTDGKWVHNRTLVGFDIPDWAEELLDINRES